MAPRGFCLPRRFLPPPYLPFILLIRIQQRIVYNLTRDSFHVPEINTEAEKVKTVNRCNEKHAALFPLLSSSASPRQYIRGGLPLPPVWLVSPRLLFLFLLCLHIQLHNSLSYITQTPPRPHHHHHHPRPLHPSLGSSLQFPWQRCWRVGCGGGGDGGGGAQGAVGNMKRRRNPCYVAFMATNFATTTDVSTLQF